MVQRNLLKRFEQYLIDEGFQPGDKLPVEQELADIFKVARSTIREIIIHLSFQGILERRPNRGTILTMPTVESIGHDLAFQLHWLGCGREELKATRLMLESTIAAEVIRYVTPTQLDQLTRINEEMRAAEMEPVRADALDLRFHLALLEITGNRLMQAFSQVITLLFSKEHRKPHQIIETVRLSINSHEKMIQAIREKNSALLQQLIYDHITPL